MNEKKMEAELREAHQRISELEAALVTYGRHLSHCYEERKAEPIGCDCGYTKAISPIQIEMPAFCSTPPGDDPNWFLKEAQRGGAMRVPEPTFVPRDPIQRWTYNVNGAYCPDCGPEDIRQEVGPLRERSGELPEACGRCGKECKHPVKGDRGAECNRTVCENEDANWFNHSTRAWYCQRCAFKLNDENRDDADRLYGHPLCTFGSGGARE